MDKIVTIAVAIIGVAILAVIVGKRSQTASVIDAFGRFFSTVLKTAVSPVT